MDSQEKDSTTIEFPAPEVPAPEFPAPGQELYLPFGGTDPDFYIPAECERRDRGFSRWLRSLPLFGR
ncbi:hypothetical protein AB4089_12700 [Arthrobacter sp. 2MCAF15]|uniref:hypothetical protein n=1 Tax=Arthrobacter sp. 2MCAF15 TaxID=3232984 RepID=UPI003F91A4AB